LWFSGFGIKTSLTQADIMAIDARYKKQLWKFLIAGFALSAVGFFLRTDRGPMSSESIGAIFSGVFWAWVIWLLWARAFKLFAGVAIVVCLLIAYGLYLEKTAPVDLPGAIAACSASCQPQWNQTSNDPTSPAYKMTVSDVRNLCDCACDSGFKSMSPALLEQMRNMKDAGAIQSNVEVRTAMQKSLTVCYAKFAPKPHQD
jgi:hypothetical protein